MITNPGGQLDPAEIIGRDKLIQELWTTLAGRCVYMNDLRRIGKTQIMVKMHAESPEAWVSVKRDLGGAHSAEEFARQAYDDSSLALPDGKQAMRQMGKLLGNAAGTEIAGILKLPNGLVAPWKEVLERTFCDIDQAMQNKGQKTRMVFFWDEVPFLIDNINKRQGPQVAMEVLDSIRALTQTYDRVRVLLTGSIGLHHVLDTLKDSGYSGTPLNRMELVRPGPLSDEHAKQLATKLLQGDGIRVEGGEEKCAAAVAALVGNVAFYIHKLINRLDKDTAHSPASIEAALQNELADPNNDWDLAHYRTRLDEHYGDRVPVAIAILDAVSIHHSRTFDEIRSDVSAQAQVDVEQLRKIINLLCKDHYLDVDKNGKHRFYLNVVARWWRISRSLREQPTS